MECEKHCDLAVSVQEVDSRSKSNVKRLDALEKRVNEVSDLTKAIAVLSENQKHMDTDLKEIKKDVKTLTDKPAKRADRIVDKVIELLIAAVLGFLLAHIGLN